MTRRLRHVLLAPLAVLALAGCSVASTITTQGAYDASDGVSVDLGRVRAGNLLVVTDAERGAGVLVGYVTNTGGDAVEVSVGAGGEAEGDVVVRLAGGETVLLGPEHEAVELTGLDAAPGATTPLRLAVEQGASEVVEVPVLDGTLGEYATLVPTPAG